MGTEKHRLESDLAHETVDREKLNELLTAYFGQVRRLAERNDVIERGIKNREVFWERRIVKAKEQCVVLTASNDGVIFI